MAGIDRGFHRVSLAECLKTGINVTQPAHVSKASFTAPMSEMLTGTSFASSTLAKPKRRLSHRAKARPGDRLLLKRVVDLIAGLAVMRLHEVSLAAAISAQAEPIATRPITVHACDDLRRIR